MKYYYLEPEVAGWIGENTIWDQSYHPPVVAKLHYELEGWLGDVLLEAFPCWIVLETTMKAIQDTKLTGVSFDELELTLSESFLELLPQPMIPKFVWMKVHGVQGLDDFGVGKGFKVTPTKQLFDGRRFVLVVSPRALDLLQRFGISHAKIDDFVMANRNV